MSQPCECAIANTGHEKANYLCRDEQKSTKLEVIQATTIIRYGWYGLGTRMTIGHCGENGTVRGTAEALHVQWAMFAQSDKLCTMIGENHYESTV